MPLDHHLLEKIKKDGIDIRFQEASMIGLKLFNNMVYNLLTKRLNVFEPALGLVEQIEMNSHDHREYENVDRDELLALISQAKGIVFFHLASVSGAYHDINYRFRAWNEYFFQAHKLDNEKYMAYLYDLGKEKADDEDF